MCSFYLLKIIEVTQGPTEEHLLVKWAPCLNIVIIIIIIIIVIIIDSVSTFCSQIQFPALGFNFVHSVSTFRTQFQPSALIFSFLHSVSTFCIQPQLSSVGLWF